MKPIKIRLFFLLLMMLSQSLYSQEFGNGYYRLTTQWLGDGKSLDVINDGVNNKLHITHTANATGQFWKITSLGNGYYRLTTQWLGENKSLDVVNDGVNNKVQLADANNVPGQLWKITNLENGYYRLTTKWLGEGKSLDVVNDGTNSKLQLADSSNVLGQYWKITKISSGDFPPAANIKTKNIYLSGFKIVLPEHLAEKPETKECLTILTKNLEEITKTVIPKNVEKLRKIPIWIQYKLKADAATWYHPKKDWLLANGYPAEMEKSVEINNIRNFIDWQRDQPYLTLHELAHGFEDLFLGEMQDKINSAYRNAVASGKYNSVSYVKGGQRKHYALTDKVEYFAELTEAYFGKNDYYPFNKKDLEAFDPEGYKLMQSAWE